MLNLKTPGSAASAVTHRVSLSAPNATPKESFQYSVSEEQWGMCVKIPDHAHKIELTIPISEIDFKKIPRNVDKDLQTIGFVMVTWGKSLDHWFSIFLVL